MKTKFFLLGAASLLFASCSNELDVPLNQASVGEGTSPLSINVLANPTTKAQITGDKLPNGSKIGVTLEATGAVDGKYDNTTYNNIYYATTDGVAWKIDNTKSILLSATDGTVYGYYPYDPDVTDIENISINATDGTDYMYATPVSGIKNSNASAPLTMNHALSVVKFTIQKAAEGGYTGAGNITKVKLEGGTMGNTGSMNIKTQTVTATAGAMTFSSPLKLTPAAEGDKNEAQVFAVPTSTQSTIKFTVTMDGQDYTATTGEVTLAKGQQYKYTLNMSSTGLTVSTVSVNPWGAEQDQGELSPELATLTDGVYAIKADGTLVAAANATDASYAGVGFIVNGKKYQVAKVDAVQTENTENTALVYWQKNNPANIPELKDYTTLDGTRTQVALPFADGSFHEGVSEEYRVYDNWTVWPSYGETAALSDFNGADNTAKILAFQNNGVDEFTIGKTVMDFRNNETYNEGKRDWFVPSLGEWAFMFLKKDELNRLLTKILNAAKIEEGETGFYWSSSEYGADAAWFFVYGLGGTVYGVDNSFKEYNNRVRLLRHL